MNTTQHHDRKRMSLERHNTLVGISFILPNFIGFACFTLIPVIFSFILSFASWDGFNAMKIIGFANFSGIFSDRVFKAALSHTFTYSVFTVFFSMLMALLLAVLLNRKVIGTNFFRSAVFFPYVASIVAVGAVWNAMFMKDAGPINAFLRLAGIANPPGWFASVAWAMPAIIIVSVWKNMGYFMLIYLAALQNIPQSLYEAASIDGANAWNKFWKITMPMLTPSHFFVFMMLTINSFKVFDLIFVLTGGGPGIATKVLANYIYDQSFTAWNFGKASAASMILFLIVGTITVIQFRAEKKFNDFL
ncbi:carbohydrate ABC transporter permease [Parasphaerochaeta coccoides]|uniref:Carbohydrate ABC transporter membrane protein 1, CUT1 family n=1 Tax=Parasphaerochaeta coccoides (strain ATCC BAA-1237 / DSM 17374 / SPN1) TaxID=760011 RepID=F4GHJ9_PARC1|nr:sugar ABC transporter permease [Parasphaerochaeta coccoides]AEC02588.1 carbohydrate ABC transporter membrane protein 1, CUT1 family [Parasphaerochaeta coccoides DSM 17374]